MKKFLFLTVSAILLAVGAAAQQSDGNKVNPADSCLIVWHKDSSQVAFQLKECPKMTFDGDSVKVKSTKTSAFAFRDIRRLSFLPEKTVKGDANGDKFVNMADVHQVVSIIYAGSQDKAGDVNGDGVVNVADIVAIRSIAAGQAPEEKEVISMTRGARTRAADEDGQQNTVRIFMASGETVDFDASQISSIDFNTRELTVSYDDTSRSLAMADIDCIMFISPVLKLVTKRLDFGKVQTDYAKTLPVTLTNTGKYPETYVIMTTGAFSVKTPYQEMVIMAGQSVDIDVTFMPGDVKAYSTSLTIASNSAAGGMLTLPVAGEGVATVAEEAEAELEPVEQEVKILIEDEAPESFEGFMISNIYGEFPVKVSASARGKNRSRSGGEYQCSAKVPVSSNGLQFHSFIDRLGNPWLFSISLPYEEPEISFSETAIALLMSTPELITRNEAEYRNAVRIIKNLDSFHAFVGQVSRLYYDGKAKNMSPDFSVLNVTPVINDLYNISKNTKDLRLNGVSLIDIKTTPELANFRLRNDYKRNIHVYTRRVKMNEGNVAITSEEETSPTIKEKLQELLDKAFNKAEDVVSEDIPLLDSEDKEYIEDLQAWVQELEESIEKEVPELQSLFQFRVPYVLESKGIDYIDAVGDGFDAYVYGIGRETSIFEVESEMFEVPFEGYDKIFVDIYGVGLAGNKTLEDFTPEEQQRIILALVQGAYVDYLKPLIDLITGISDTSKDLKKIDKFKYDFRYGARKYPEWALMMKLFNAFVKNKSNLEKLSTNLKKGDPLAVLKQLSKFAWDQFTSIPNESDNVEDKRTYTNLIYNIYKKQSGISATSEEFRKMFKSESKKFLRAVKIIYATMEASETAVDLIGAYKALKNAEMKGTHIIDKYNKPTIVMKEPTMVYLTHDVTPHFEWETYKSNTIGEYVYDLELMTETSTGVSQTVVLSDIEGNSCDYDLNKLGGAKNAMKIYYRLVAHNPAYSQIFVETEFMPLVWRAKAKAPEMVDLGLPSGTLWAQSNLGAETSGDYGNYYAWGETATKDAYSWSNYKYCSKGQQNALTKYNTKSHYGKVDDKTQLDATDDMMKANCGYYYGIPTKEDWEELENQCTWTYNPGLGYTVRGKNRAVLFLPFAGYRSGLNLYDNGTGGYYWSSTLDQNSPDDAWFMHIRPNNHELGSYYRSQGRCIRPVMHKSNYLPPKDVRDGLMSTKQ